jgi:prephenate dehydratase
MIRKSLVLILSVASLALSGCGQSSATESSPAESTVAAESPQNESPQAESSAPDQKDIAPAESSPTESAATTESAQAESPATSEVTPEVTQAINAADAAVSYLGPAGTYTEEAAQFFFPETENMMPKGTVDEAIADVVEGRADYAVIPQENTLGGAVTNYVDALIKQKDVNVIGEVILPISQTLMGVPGAKIEDIKTVCSHAQGIKQSETWRKEHLPGVATEEMASTAAAAEYVAQQQDKSIAAIAAPGAAALYGLDILAENVQITDANKTRFYVLAAEEPEGDAFPRAVFVATCEANRIDDIIVEIHESGVELVTIHDRPEGSALGSYYYVIEVESEAGITQEQIDRISGIEEVRLVGRFRSVEKTQ